MQNGGEGFCSLHHSCPRPAQAPAGGSRLCRSKGKGKCGGAEGDSHSSWHHLPLWPDPVPIEVTDDISSDLEGTRIKVLMCMIMLIHTPVFANFIKEEWPHAQTFPIHPLPLIRSSPPITTPICSIQSLRLWAFLLSAGQIAHSDSTHRPRAGNVSHCFCSSPQTSQHTEDQRYPQFSDLFLAHTYTPAPFREKKLGPDPTNTTAHE